MEAFNELMFFIVALVRDYWWVAAPFLALGIFWEIWVQYTDLEFDIHSHGVLLEVKLPQELAKQSAPAMDHVISAFSHVYKQPMLYEKYLQGMGYSGYSLEIAGIEGEVRFFIRCPQERKRYSISQIYAQFPGAEVSEVEDYTKKVPLDIKTNPDSEWDVWGTEFMFLKEDAYPLRTYVDFAMDKPGEEEERVDPLAGIVEALGTCGPGEHFWYQIIVKPTFSTWEKQAEEIINKLSGRKEKKKASRVEKVFGLLDKTVQATLGQPIEEEKKPEDEFPKMRVWTDPETQQMKALDRKRSKVGFRCVVRVLYVCKKEILNKRHAQGMFGFFRPFSTAYNALIPDRRNITSQDYFFVPLRVEARKRDLLWRYRSRSTRAPGVLLNTEELATMFHIPGKEVSAPQVIRMEAKRATAPVGVPRPPA